MSGPAPGLDGRRDARLQVVAVDILHEDVGLHLFVVLEDLPAELGVALGNGSPASAEGGNSTPVHTPGSPPCRLTLGCPPGSASMAESNGGTACKV